MGKHDHPSLQFVVENGRLVPASPYEQEVLDTYQRGAHLTVTLHQKRSLPLLKKYWAALRDIVENCKTPWNSADEASDALKLALGITDIGKTTNGKWFIRAGSISFASMDEAAFRDFYDKSMAVLAEVTGIDPEQLQDRYRHIQEHEPASATSPGADADEGSAADPAPQNGGAPDQSAEADTAEPEEPSAPSGNSGSALDEKAWLRDFARAMVAAIGPDEQVAINQSKGFFRDDLGEDVRKKARSITNYARAVCRGEIDLGNAIEMIAGIAGVEPKEIAS